MYKLFVEVSCTLCQLVETLLKVCPDEGAELFSPVFANILNAFIEQVVCNCAMLMFSTQCFCLVLNFLDYKC